MLTIRKAQKKDAELIVQYIRELAEFEKLSHECEANPELIRKWLFGATARAECLLVEWEMAPAGFAVYSYNFSTFLAKPGIYAEDVFVRPEFRRKGIARRIFQHLAQKALTQGYGRLEWRVLDWNKEALTFYESMGATAMSEWTVERISGDALLKLAAG